MKHIKECTETGAIKILHCPDLSNKCFKLLKNADIQLVHTLTRHQFTNFRPLTK